MVLYRRNFIPGGTYFFTVTLIDRSATYLTDHFDLLREAFNSIKNKSPYKTHAFVILPDHIHCIWELPENDADYPSRWSAIKTYFSRGLIKNGIEVQRNRRGEYLLWQRRFWEHTIRDELDFQRHVDYIHINPVKHGLVSQVRDWDYSSFHEFVKRDLLSETWTGKVDTDDYNFGERNS